MQWGHQPVRYPDKGGSRRRLAIAVLCARTVGPSAHGPYDPGALHLSGDVYTRRVFARPISPRTAQARRGHTVHGALTR